jgi:flagellar hook-associated protein 3 FlgL
MRISDATRMDRLVASTTALDKKIATVSQRASSGIAIDVPSTDPIAAAAYLRSRGSVQRMKGYGDAVRDARGELELTEAAFAQAQDIIARAREIALSAANSTYSAQDRSQFASELGQLREQLIAAANQKGPNGYLLGGSLTETPPFTSAGAFQGNDDARRLEVNPGMTLTINGSGAKAFTAAGGEDVFALFAQLQTAVSTNDASGITDLGKRMGDAHYQVGTARGAVGYEFQRLDIADAAQTQLKVLWETRQGEASEIDPAQVYSQLSALQNTLQQSVAAARTQLQALSIQRFG